MQEFVEKWKSKKLGKEESEGRSFWIELLRVFCGIARPETFLEFEIPVQLENSTGFIDIWIPETKIIIEQKSRSKKLDRAVKQSDGKTLTPFEQAKRYDDHRPANLKANWIITCNFDEFWIYDLNDPKPEDGVTKFSLKDLPNQRLTFLVSSQVKELYRQEKISAKAGSLVKSFRDLFAIDGLNDHELLVLNRFCVQIVFCLYAENAGVFKKGQFLEYLEIIKYKDLRTTFKKHIEKLFKRLDSEILPELVDDRLESFPYVDGELFSDTNLAVIDGVLKKSNLDHIFNALVSASANIDWSTISPTIFGAIFESIMNPDTKRSEGIHYTSPENIHKVIDPLFLDDLNREFETCEDLERFHDKIANLKFFDPACGSGNFLTETYISLRKLENRILEQTHGSIRVTIENFYGIEINDWAVQVAKLALWISEHQMNGGKNFLPLRRNANIIEGNALTLDWKKIVPDADYIIGNPPYAGRRYRSKTQAEEISRFFDYKDVDYVACWFKKASDYIRDSRSEVGFVSTDSICQGEQVYPIWQDLFDDGIKINFALRSFKWENEYPDKKAMAQVFCVIIGFARFDREIKTLDGVRVKNINGYLLDALNICFANRSKPTCKVPHMRNGNVPLDGDALKIDEEDYPQFEQYSRFVKKLVGARELLYNEKRFVLWLVGTDPHEIRSIKPIYERVKLCRKNRLAMNDRASQKLAESPTIFRDTLNPDFYIALPMVSAGARKYIPMAYLNHEYIPTNQVQIIPDATLELFGILSSIVHVTWFRSVAGYLGTSYRYSIGIVYNNFPFPSHNENIERTAQMILDARANHPNSSLAELYDPNLMPTDLRKAHEKNDLAVLDSYGFPHDISDNEIIARLFELYQKLTSGD